MLLLDRRRSGCTSRMKLNGAHPARDYLVGSLLFGVVCASLFSVLSISAV